MTRPAIRTTHSRPHAAAGDQQALREAAPARIKVGITPVEPRILLYAALDLDPGGAGLALFQAAIGALDAQTKELQELFACVAGRLVDPAGDGPSPIEVNVAGGHALLNAGDGSSDPAKIRMGFLDINGASLAELDLADVRSFFAGALIDFTVDGAFDLDGIDFRLPDLAEFFSNINVLAIINAPRTLLRGLDSIIQQTDSFLRSVDLPIIGSNLGTGITVFKDMRIGVIERTLAVASNPD